MRLLRTALLASALALCLAAPASASSFGATGFDGRALDEGGALFTQAGGDPHALTNEVEFSTVMRTVPLFGEVPLPDEPVKDVFVEVPAGLVGNPTAAATCEIGQLAYDNFGEQGPFCPPASQVGVTTVKLTLGIQQTLPLYNMTPPPGTVARFGFNIIGTVVLADAELRNGSDYGVTVNFRNIGQGTAVLGSSLTLWGDPASPAHDAERSCPGKNVPDEGGPTAPAKCPDDYTRPDPIAFLRYPTSCTAPDEGLLWSLETDSWYHPGVFSTTSFRTHEAPGLPEKLPPFAWGFEKGTTGCDQVPFEPAISVKPTSNQADSPTGLEVDLTLPQSDDPTAIATSDLKKAIVALPEGMSVNPSQANGLGACSSKEIGLLGTGFPAPAPIHFTPEPANCPDDAKVGSVEVTTPLLDHPLQGDVYLAAQKDNPFKSLLAIYITVDDPQTGIVLKLPGHIEIGPDGQLITTFDNQPQTPFDHFHLSFFGGPNAPLINPPHCGSYASEAKLSPWARPAEAVNLQSAFQITSGPNGSPCPPKPAPFDPKLSAGTKAPIAGAFSPFALKLSREDGSQRLSGLSLTLPPGLLGKPAGIPYCPEAALNSLSGELGSGAAQLTNPSCPPASRVGVVTVGAGAGPNPFYVQTGKAYLAGPYKGAPLSLAIATPAIAGPFDLGNVLVRAALYVNPETAQVTAVSDPLPRILHGIPLDLRDVRVNLDRPSFTLNPTSCDPMAIASQVRGTEGAIANPSSRFQVGECARLGFKPKLAIKLRGGTKRSEFPALKATLTMPKATGANIAKAVVSLPHSEFLAQSHIRTICTRVQFAADDCPKGSIYGHARAITPLLDQPLSGPVYLRSSSNPLPDLVASLKGQIEVDLVGRIDSKGGGIRTTFAQVPDAPVSKFTLTMQGGRKSLLENSRGLCASTNRATALFDGQNGKVRDLRPVVRASGCGGKVARKGRR